MDSRRIARAFIAAAAVAALTQAATEAQTPPAASAPQVRMRWQDFVSGPDGAQRLASLQRGVLKMKSLDSSPPGSADYRRSWQYWANIHGYYGQQSPDGTVEQQIAYLKKQGMSRYVPYYQGIVDQTPPDSVAETVWATCQHSGNTQALNFFGWHRMYLFYFEQVLRWAAGDDTLRLPYWDYTDPAQLALPAEFRATSAPIYDAKRDPDMNTGAAQLDPRSTDVDDALLITDYFKYERRIEQHVHGYVHCTVGPNCPVAHMGDVPVAGNDPVFYSHHANIDRLWACWQQLHGTPAGAWQDQPFSFVDETGTMQTKPVKDFLDSTTLGYVYDNVTNCSRPAAVASLASMAVAPPESTPPAGTGGGDRKRDMIGSSRTVAIKSATTRVDLDVPRQKLAGALADPAQPGTVELVLRDIIADRPPGVLFHVFLEKKGSPASRQHVGTISWFGAFRHRHGGHDEAPEKRTLTFDVADELRELGGSALASAGLTVVFEATDGRVPTDPAKLRERNQAAGRAFRAESNLRIGSIELHAVPPLATPQEN